MQVIEGEAKALARWCSEFLSAAVEVLWQPRVGSDGVLLPAAMEVL